MPLSIIKKHSKKVTVLLIIGGLGLGGYLSYRFVRKRFSLSHDKNATSLEYTRKVRYFHDNLQAADNRTFTLSTILRDKLLAMTNVEDLVEKIKANSSDKIENWENLRVKSLSRVITGVYLLSGLVLYVRTELNIIGGCMFRESMCKGDDVGSKGEGICSLTGIDYRLQKRYMEYAKYLIEVGSVKLMAVVEPVVRSVLGRIALKQTISFEKFDEILIEIQNTLELGKGNNKDEEFETLSLQELFLPPENPDDDDEEDDLNFLINSTRDILEQDFLHILSNCIKVCFLYVSQWTAAQCPITPSDCHSQPEEITVQFPRLVISISKCFPFLFIADQDSLLQQLLTKREVLTFSKNIYEAFSSS